MEWSCACGNLTIALDGQLETREVRDFSHLQLLLSTNNCCALKGSAATLSARAKFGWLRMKFLAQCDYRIFSTQDQEETDLPVAECPCVVHCCAVCLVRLYAQVTVSRQEVILIMNDMRRSTASQAVPLQQRSALFGIDLPEAFIEQLDTSALKSTEFDPVVARAEIELIASKYITEKTEEFRAALANEIQVANRDKERLLSHIGKLFNHLGTQSESTSSAQKTIESTLTTPLVESEPMPAGLKKSAAGENANAVVIDQLGSELEDAVLAEMDIGGGLSQQELDELNRDEREGSAAVKTSDDDTERPSDITTNHAESIEIQIGEEAMEHMPRQFRSRAEIGMPVYSASVPISIPLRNESEKGRLRAGPGPKISTLAENEDEQEAAAAGTSSPSNSAAVPVTSDVTEKETLRFGANLRKLRSQTVNVEPDRRGSDPQQQQLAEETDDRTSQIGRKIAESVRQTDAFALFERPNRARPRAYTNEAMGTRPPLNDKSSNQPRVITFDFDRR